jgi:hypothetical protein
MRNNALEEINQRCRFLLGAHVEEHQTEPIAQCAFRIKPNQCGILQPGANKRHQRLKQQM